MQKCLTRIFGTLPSITVRPNASFLTVATGFAISGYRSISLPGSCESFYDDQLWVLHEYYHVLMGWEVNRNFLLTYIGQAIANGFRRSNIPAERAADDFALLLDDAMTKCLKSCSCRQ